MHSETCAVLSITPSQADEPDVLACDTDIGVAQIFSRMHGLVLTRHRSSDEREDEEDWNDEQVHPKGRIR